MSNDFKATVITHQLLLCSYWSWAVGIAHFLVLETDKEGVRLRTGVGSSSSSSATFARDSNVASQSSIEEFKDVPVILLPTLVTGGKTIQRICQRMCIVFNCRNVSLLVICVCLEHEEDSSRRWECIPCKMYVDKNHTELALDEVMTLYKFIRSFLVHQRYTSIVSFYPILKELYRNLVLVNKYNEMEGSIMSEMKKKNDANEVKPSFSSIAKDTLNSLCCRVADPHSVEMSFEMPLGISSPKRWQFECMPSCSTEASKCDDGLFSAETTKAVVATTGGQQAPLHLHHLQDPHICDTLANYLDCPSLDIFHEFFYLYANASPSPSAFKRKKGASKGEQVLEYEHSLHVIYQPYLLDLCLNPYRATSWFALAYTFRSLLYAEIDTDCIQQHSAPLLVDPSRQLGNMLAYLETRRLKAMF
jgi:hypothetical protein